MEAELGSLYSLGIIGAGQIARMTHQAALKLGITPRLLAENLDDSAALVAPDARFTHPDAISAFCEMCEVVTIEHSRIDVGLLQALEATGVTIRPGTKTLRAAFDKLHQRKVLGLKGFRVPHHAAAKGPDDVIDFAQKFDYPIVIKSVQPAAQSHDSVRIVDNQEEALKVLSEHTNTDLMVEEYQDILEELVVIVARRPGGNSRCYPIAQVINDQGLCREVRVPADIGPHIAREARDVAQAIADELGAVGVVSVELFLTADGIVVNEIAARPHNAGHYTIEATPTSQFENHVRAILDLPIGPVALNSPAAVTLNVIGDRVCTNPADNLAEALSVEGAQVHLYGKIPAPGVKLGHVTASGDTLDDALEIASRAETALLGQRYFKGQRE